MHYTAVLAHAAVLALLLTALRYSATATVLRRYSATVLPPSAVQCSVLLQCSALLANNNSATVQLMM